MTLAGANKNDGIRTPGQYKILTMGELLALVTLILLTYFSFMVTSQGHSYSVTTIVLFAAIVISAFAVLTSGFMENAHVLSRSLIAFFAATILACTNIMFFEGLQSVVLIILMFIGLYGIFQEIFEIKGYEETSETKGRLRVIDNTQVNTQRTGAAGKKQSKPSVSESSGFSAKKKSSSGAKSKSSGKSTRKNAGKFSKSSKSSRSVPSAVKKKSSTAGKTKSKTSDTTKKKSAKKTSKKKK